MVSHHESWCRQKTNISYQKAFESFLKLIEEIHSRYQIIVHAYCLIPNHYHLLIETRFPNLSKAMKHLDGVYTQHFNVQQKTYRPLFRRRIKSIIVDANDYHLRISRYIHLNPVAAGLTKKAHLIRTIYILQNIS